MQFTKRLRDGVRSGEITCSVRIWMRPHVTVGNRYRMEEGEIEVDSIVPITYADVTPAVALEQAPVEVVGATRCRRRLDLESERVAVEGDGPRHVEDLQERRETVDGDMH